MINDHGVNFLETIITLVKLQVKILPIQSKKCIGQIKSFPVHFGIMALILKRIQPFLQLADLQWMYFWQKYLKIYGLVNKRVKYLFLYSIIQMRNLFHSAVDCLYQFFE